jgi:type I restriction-modification system DNA methylase subunit
MGLVFLRHAYSRYLAVKDTIEANLPTRGGKTRPLNKEDFSQKSAIFLRPKSQFDHLVSLPDSEDRAKAIIGAMESIEGDYDNLRGVLPKSEYQELDNDVLGQLLRTLNPDELKKVSGDVFGRIYEYFLTQFADQKAHDGGEFFTPVSLVSLIAHVLDPEGGTVLDPACGSGGMFVQSARIVEEHGQSPTDRLTFRGLEKNATTIRLAKMNLAVHGLEGDIQKAITYYEDPQELLGKADFVMANPPFNVDEIDADKVKTDPRLPFGLPGVNKKDKVSNGNYVWISYFYSYLSEKGRAGFVMSSQASSAGGGEAKVRQKLIETGDVDVMVAIRSNFFYTRTVPCELWFIDRGKPEQPSSPALFPIGEGSREIHYRAGYDFSGLIERARILRQNQTPAEDVLWVLLQNRRFLGLKFRRQHQFGDYILDFYCHAKGVAIELDGKVHETRRSKDAKRDAYLESQGLKVIRVRNKDLLTDPKSALSFIASQFPRPPEGSPLPLGEDLGEGRFSAPLNRKGNILMIDARNIYRKVTRKIFDFSPEQQQNLLAIVWLYRDQTNKYLDLISGYCRRTLDEGTACFSAKDESGEVITLLPDFTAALNVLTDTLQPFLNTLTEDAAHAEIQKELAGALPAFHADVKAFKQAVIEQEGARKKQKATNGHLKQAVDRLAPLAESSRDLIKQTDLLYKLASRLIETCEKECDAKASDAWVSKDVTRARKAVDEAR